MTTKKPATKKAAGTKPKAPAKPSTRKRSPKRATTSADHVDEIEKPLTEKEELFCQEFLHDLNATQAYIRAFGADKPRSASARASMLLTKINVQARIATLRDERNERLAITQDDVLRGYLNRKDADVRNLVEYRREACRYCYGHQHRYHFTPAEFERALENHKLAKIENPDLGEFDEQGGVGFDPRKEPNPDCPECFGDGRGRQIIKDTRFLDEKALSLYAGVEITKDGMKVRINSQDNALDALARHTGFFEKDNEQKVAKPPSVESLNDLFGDIMGRAAEKQRQVDEERRNKGHGEASPD